MTYPEKLPLLGVRTSSSPSMASVPRLAERAGMIRSQSEADLASLRRFEDKRAVRLIDSFLPSQCGCLRSPLYNSILLIASSASLPEPVSISAARPRHTEYPFKSRCMLTRSKSSSLDICCWKASDTIGRFDSLRQANTSFTVSVRS